MKISPEGFDEDKSVHFPLSCLDNADLSRLTRFSEASKSV